MFLLKLLGPRLVFPDTLRAYAAQIKNLFTFRDFYLVNNLILQANPQTHKRTSI